MDVVDYGMKRSKYSLPPPLGSTPWVVLPHGRHRQIQTFFNPVDGSLHHRSIPEMQHKKCLGCARGWLLMQHNFGGCSLLNIASMKIVPLPPLSGLPDIPMTFTLSPPSSTDPLNISGCTAVVLVGKRIFFCKIHGGKSIAAEWTERKVKNLRLFNYLTGGFAWLKEKLYIDTRRNCLAIVDFSSPTIRVRLLLYSMQHIDMLEEPIYKQDIALIINDIFYYGMSANDIKMLRSTASYRQTLIESRGQIFTVVLSVHRYNRSVTKAEAFKLDLSKLKWERVETIGDDQAIFVGECGTTYSYTVKDERVEGNCIYFMQPSYDGMRWCKFSLNTRVLSYTLFYPGLRKTWQNSYLATATA